MSSKFTNDSEASASELLENVEVIMSLGDVISRLKSSTKQYIWSLKTIVTN